MGSVRGGPLVSPMLQPTFHRLMESCLGELKSELCILYLDDIIVFSQTPEEHLVRLQAVFDKLKAAGLK